MAAYVRTTVYVFLLLAIAGTARAEGCKRCVGHYGANGRGASRIEMDVVWYCLDCDCKNFDDHIEDPGSQCDLRAPYKDTLRFQCAPGCPKAYIGDGVCDRKCDNSECNNDGGDCAGEAMRRGSPAVAGFTFSHHGDFSLNNPATVIDADEMTEEGCGAKCNALNCVAFSKTGSGCTLYYMVAGYNKEEWDGMHDNAYISDCAKDNKGTEEDPFLGSGIPMEFSGGAPMSAWMTCAGTNPETVLEAIRDNADRKAAKEQKIADRKWVKESAKAERQEANDARAAAASAAMDALGDRRSARAAKKESDKAALAAARAAKLGQYATGGEKESEALDKESERHAATLDKLDKQKESKQTRAETQVSQMGDAARVSHTNKANAYLSAQIDKNELLDLKRDQKKSLDAVRAERKTQKATEKAEAKAIRDAIVASKKK